WPPAARIPPPMPSRIAAPWGQRCQMHISQGGRPPRYWKAKAPKSRVALTPPAKSAAAVSLRKVKARFLPPFRWNLGEFGPDFDTWIEGPRELRQGVRPSLEATAPGSKKSLFF